MVFLSENTQFSIFVICKSSDNCLPFSVHFLHFIYSTEQGLMTVKDLLF